MSDISDEEDIGFETFRTPSRFMIEGEWFSFTFMDNKIYVEFSAGVSQIYEFFFLEDAIKEFIKFLEFQGK